MANPEQLAKILKDSVQTWNDWRKKNPDIPIDLDGVNLSEAKLDTVDLSRANLKNADLGRALLNEANLSHAVLRDADLRLADLGWANLYRANLDGANLQWANLQRADLHGADLRRVNLDAAKLHGADLRGVNLDGAYLFGADLRGPKMRGADLRGAKLRAAKLFSAELYGADLRGANLTKADLTRANMRGARLEGAILSSANLQCAHFDQTTLTGANLWETQRAGWSIKGIICEYVYWDKESKQSTHYTPGEFEHLYSDQTRIELLYPGGITTFELNTLPALLHHLTTRYPDSGIRLKSMEETGGGSKIIISIDDTNTETLRNIDADATSLQSATISLRDDEKARLRIQMKFLLDEIHAEIRDTTTQFHFHGPATNIAIATGNSTVHAHQTYNDTKTLLALLDQIATHRNELTLSNTQETKLEDAVESIQQELAKPNPKPSLISSGLKVIQDIATKVVENAAEKALTENWHPILSQLTTLMHHWTL